MILANKHALKIRIWGNDKNHKRTTEIVAHDNLDHPAITLITVIKLSYIVQLKHCFRRKEQGSNFRRENVELSERLSG